MKLHFAKNWLSQGDSTDVDPQVTVGPRPDATAVLSANDKFKVQERWEEFPIREMAKVGWVDATAAEIGKVPKLVVERFLSTLDFSRPAFAHYRRGQGAGEIVSWIWASRLVQRAARENDLPKFSADAVSIELGQELGRLSVFDDGPIRARDFLAEFGIALIVERTLPGSRLDGAAFMLEEGTPVIGLTLRFDRIDYFWFTLLHEFVHVVRHLRNGSRVFVESLDDVEASNDPLEQEADYYAQEAFIPRSIWRRSDAYRRQTVEHINELANDLGINPAIIAGRIRRDTNRYDLFTDLVGHNQVRKHFAGTQWD